MRYWRRSYHAPASPEGRRTAANILANNCNKTVIQIQRDCGQPCPKRGRGRSTIGEGTNLRHDRSGERLLQCCRALRATCTLPTVFPSLRAHEPNPAGLEIHPDLAGYRVSGIRNRRRCLLPISCAPDISGAIAGGKAMVPLSLRTGACGHSSPHPAPGR